MCAKIMELYLQKAITAINSIFLKKLLMILIRVIFAGEIGEDLVLINHVEGPTCGCASMTSFGHTIIWNYG
jgi:hypothetical protein